MQLFIIRGVVRSKMILSVNAIVSNLLPTRIIIIQRQQQARMFLEGSQNRQNTVIIDEDENDIKERKKALVESKIREIKIKEAELCADSSKNKGFSLKMASFDPRQQQRLKTEILSYFSQYINLQGNFAPPLNPVLGEEAFQLCCQALVLHGVDFMSTKRVFKYFAYFDPTHIAWADESNCVVKFKDAFICKKALLVNKKDRPNHYLDDQQIKTYKLQPLSWHKLDEYYELGFAQNLIARYALKQEIEKYIEGGDSLKADRSGSMFSLYETVKLNFLLQHFEEPAQRQYQAYSGNHFKNSRASSQNNNYTRNQFRKPTNTTASRLSPFPSRTSPQYQDIDSRENYSFDRDPQIKAEVENEDNEEDLGNLSFLDRFEKMCLENRNRLLEHEISFQKDKHNSSAIRKGVQDMSMQLQENSFVQQRAPRMKEQEANLNESLSFRKGQVVVLDDQ